MDSQDIDRLARLIFEYGESADSELMPASAILAFGSHDEHVAERAAELWHEGLAPFIIFTGGLGRITKRLWQEPEAERFAHIAEEAGVPVDAIVTEPDSTNTGDNIRFTRELMRKKGIAKARLIVVERPYRALRTRATVSCLWPGLTFQVAVPDIGYDEYARWYASGLAPISKHEFISVLVGDVERNVIYPERGWQDPVMTAETVLDASRMLAQAGYTEQLLPDVSIW
jgi:uncharacterized SAM-binding protein YcdF (DUF218 family)